MIEMTGEVTNSDGLTIRATFVIEDPNGDPGAVANDLMEMVNQYMDDQEDGGEAQFEDDFVSQLRRNLEFGR